MAQDELLRVFTPAGAPTNTFKPRAEVHRDGDWHGTVHLWLVNSSAELLFQRRSDRTELHPGLWDVSAAGHIVGDESPAMSLEREALEELGLVVDARQAKWLFTLRTESQTATLHERVFQYIYLIDREIDQHELQPQATEVAALAWHHYSQLEHLIRDAGGFVPRIDEYARLLDYLNTRF